MKGLRRLQISAPGSGKTPIIRVETLANAKRIARRVSAAVGVPVVIRDLGPAKRGRL